MRNSFILFAFTIFLSFKVEAHAIKMSTCIIKYDQQSHIASVGINFFWDDFSICLFKEDQTLNNQKTITEIQKEQIKKYIQSHLSISFSGRKELEISNIKLTENILHIDAQIKNISYTPKESDITIKNTLLIKEYRSQMNLVKIDLEGKKNYHVLNFDADKTIVRKIY